MGAKKLTRKQKTANIEKVVNFFLEEIEQKLSFSVGFFQNLHFDTDM
jgi:hypothetical protein